MNFRFQRAEGVHRDTAKSTNQQNRATTVNRRAKWQIKHRPERVRDLDQQLNLKQNRHGPARERRESSPTQRKTRLSAPAPSHSQTPVSSVYRH
jgi:hypothetical protein